MIKVLYDAGINSTAWADYTLTQHDMLWVSWRRYHSGCTIFKKQT